MDVHDISRAIQARHLATPLARAFVVRPEDKAGAISSAMKSRQFTHAPVVAKERVIGLFAATAARPRSAVESQMRRLDAALIVSSDTPLTDLASFMSDEPFLFVVQGRKIVGFVTPADMGSAPARTHYYLLLAGLEMLLAALIRERFPDQRGAVSLLSEGRQVTHGELVEKLRQTDEFLDDDAAMSLMDLINLAGKLKEYRALCLEGGKTWSWLIKGLVNFRNDVMHPVREFAATRDGMLKLADFDERLLTLLRCAHLVATSAN